MVSSARWWALSITLVSAALIYILSPVLAPFLIAAVFAYMTNPIVNRLMNLKIPRTFGVLIVFILTLLIIFLLIFLLLPPLEHQIGVLLSKIPLMLNWIQETAIPWINKYVDVSSIVSLENIKSAIGAHWQQAGNVIQNVIVGITRSGLSLIVFVLNMLLIFVVAFYLLRDWNSLINGMKSLLPRRGAATVVRLADECNDVLAAFFKGQLLVMFCIGIVYSFGLTVIGLDVALLIGLVAGVITFIPYLGFAVGLIAALIAAFWQFNDALHLVYVVIVFGIGNVLEGMVLTPLLVGDKVGLHPVAVIFSVLAGGQLFGFTGVLLALPVASVIMVLLGYVHQQYMSSELYQPTESSQ